MSFIQSFIKGLISSLGLKRKLSNFFQVFAVLATTVPQLAPLAGIAQAIASWLGVAGVGHSLAAGTFKIDLHTIAAFISAVLLAAKDIPALVPYAGLLQALADILAALGVASLTAK